MIGDLLSDWPGRLVVIVFAACLLLFGVVIWLSVADSYAHRNDTCVKSHQETIVIYQKVGGVSVPEIITTTVCDKWVPNTDL